MIPSHRSSPPEATTRPCSPTRSPRWSTKSPTGFASAFSSGATALSTDGAGRRSGKQNIVEGSKAATTSKEMEIKLTNVARASLEELLEDYRDYLRVRDLPIWNKQSREALYVRKLAMTTPLTFDLFREFVETRPAEVVANIALCLIHQTNFLLDRQLKAQEKAFSGGGRSAGADDPRPPASERSTEETQVSRPTTVP